MEKIWKNVWNLNIPTNIKIFIWRTLKSIIPTRTNLSMRGINLNTIYSVCHSKPENTDHILFSCKRATDIWPHILNLQLLKDNFISGYRYLEERVNAVKFLKKDSSKLRLFLFLVQFISCLIFY